MKDQKDFQPLHLKYTFQASATTVYDAWITKPVAELWLFKNETNRLHFEADLNKVVFFRWVWLRLGNNHFNKAS